MKSGKTKKGRKARANAAMITGEHLKLLKALTEDADSAPEPEIAPQPDYNDFKFDQSDVDNMSLDEKKASLKMLLGTKFDRSYKS